MDVDILGLRLCIHTARYEVLILNGGFGQSRILCVSHVSINDSSYFSGFIKGRGS